LKELEQILIYFPMRVRKIFLEFLKESNINYENIEEIRIRVNKPICIKIENRIKVLDYVILQEDIIELFQKICDNSIYSYTNQICQGFITIRGGHRIGITGSCVIENNKVINIRYVSSLNIRIARQKLDCSRELLSAVLDFENDNIFTTLIVAPPGCGKTTILRDLIRVISNGINNKNFSGKTIGIVDERGEISAMYKGIPQNDIGIRIDVIENVSKADGMQMLIRSMAPQVISCDEIGCEQDINAIKYAISSGVKGIFTSHGSSIEDLKLNSNMNELLQKFIIERIIFLSETVKGQAKELFELDKFEKKYVKKRKNNFKDI